MNEEFFFNKSPKWANESISDSFIGLFLCLFSFFRCLSSALTLFPSSLSFVPCPLVVPRRTSQKLKTDWLTDKSIKQLRMSTGAWSKRFRQDLATENWIQLWQHSLSVLYESAIKEQTNRLLVFFYLVFGISVNKPAFKRHRGRFTKQGKLEWGCNKVPNMPVEVGSSAGDPN